MLAAEARLHLTVSILILNRNLFNRVKVLQNIAMSSSKKKNAPLPASSAGLLRFFEDETKGVKIKPELVLSIAGGIIGVSILIRLIFPV
jgi:preprotein translocase subunit Sec61beta